MDLGLSSYLPKTRFALAYSGGGDSTALLHALRGHDPLVLIVDHDLRAGSRAEAQAALAFAQSLGLDAHILTWKHDGITGGVQAKARRARYKLLGDACRAAAITDIVLGHTEDDQAETVLMRMDRQTGWRGAAGMAAVAGSPLWPELAGITLWRPMLAVSRADVRAYLAAHKLPYVDDPSNENRDFARIRARERLSARPKLRADMLSLGADMQRGRAAERDYLLDIIDRRITIDEFGCIHFMGLLPRALLVQLCRAASGKHARAYPDRLDYLERAMQQADFINGTFMGAFVTHGGGGAFTISRDPVAAFGRSGVPALPAQELAQRTLWDGRFWIEGGHSVEPAAGHLGRLPKPLKAALKGCLAAARPTLPLVTKDGEIVAAGPYDAAGSPSPAVHCAVSPRIQAQLKNKLP